MTVGYFYPAAHPYINHIRYFQQCEPEDDYFLLCAAQKGGKSPALVLSNRNTQRLKTENFILKIKFLKWYLSKFCTEGSLFHIVSILTLIAYKVWFCNICVYSCTTPATLLVTLEKYMFALRYRIYRLVLPPALYVALMYDWSQPEALSPSEPKNEHDKIFVGSLNAYLF